VAGSCGHSNELPGAMCHAFQTDSAPLYFSSRVCDFLDRGVPDRWIGRK